MPRVRVAASRRRSAVSAQSTASLSKPCRESSSASWGRTAPESRTLLRMLAGVLRPTSERARFRSQRHPGSRGRQDGDCLHVAAPRLYSDLTCSRPELLCRFSHRAPPDGEGGEAGEGSSSFELEAFLRQARRDALRGMKQKLGSPRPHRRAPAPPPGRAHVRSRFDLAPRPVAHGARDRRSRSSAVVSTGLSRRGRSGSIGAPPPPGTGPRLRDSEDLLARIEGEILVSGRRLSAKRERSAASSLVLRVAIFGDRLHVSV